MEEIASKNQQLKQQLRKNLIKQRRQIPLELWQQKNTALSDRLANWKIFQQSQNVLAFASFRQEPDLSSLWQRFPDKNWGFCRCVDQDLIWHQVAIADFDHSMRLGAFGILEPESDLPLINLETIDLILIAATACDRYGYRLGYGGGFYDRWLPHSTGKKVGVIFDEFYLEELPSDPWDIKLEAIATDKQLIVTLPNQV